MPQMVTGRKYSAKTRCFTAVIFDPFTKIMSSLSRCNHQTIREYGPKFTMRRQARSATIYCWYIEAIPMCIYNICLSNN